MRGQQLRDGRGDQSTTAISADGLMRRKFRRDPRGRGVAVVVDEIELGDADLIGERDLADRLVVLSRGIRAS